MLLAVEARFGGAFSAAGSPDALVGAFHTEFGPLNRIVHLWRCADDAARECCHAGPLAASAWLADEAAHVVITAEALVPVAMSPDLLAGSPGPFFELRTYTYPAGELPQLLAAWERAMPTRAALGSPVAAIWVPKDESCHRLVHLWPYRSLQDREDIRREVRTTGLWPPFKTDEAAGRRPYTILDQANLLMLPAVYSPLQ